MQDKSVSKIGHLKLLGSSTFEFWVFVTLNAEPAFARLRRGRRPTACPERQSNGSNSEGIREQAPNIECGES
jgi:hypothetical protein